MPIPTSFAASITGQRQCVSSSRVAVRTPRAKSGDFDRSPSAAPDYSAGFNGSPFPPPAKSGDFDRSASPVPDYSADFNRSPFPHPAKSGDFDRPFISPPHTPPTSTDAPSGLRRSLRASDVALALPRPSASVRSRSRRRVCRPARREQLSAELVVKSVGNYDRSRPTCADELEEPDMESGMIRAPASGPTAGRCLRHRVHRDAEAVESQIFRNFPTHAGRGSDVIEFVPKQGVTFELGKPGELF